MIRGLNVRNSLCLEVTPDRDRHGPQRQGTDGGPQARRGAREARPGEAGRCIDRVEGLRAGLTLPPLCYCTSGELTPSKSTPFISDWPASSCRYWRKAVAKAC